MIEKLLEIEKNLRDILLRSEIHTMFIDYHKPYVKRIWVQHDDLRIYLHEIDPCGESSEALYHPHPWKSAVKILKGHYEMGIGHSSTDEIPKTDCKLILPQGSVYEMIEEDAWHYVNPLDGPIFSLMITGERNQRKMPVEPMKEFRKLTDDEFEKMILTLDDICNWELIDVSLNVIKQNRL